MNVPQAAENMMMNRRKRMEDKNSRGKKKEANVGR
jgi:hypothetical protein